MNNFCPNCGTKVPTGTTFCPNCGTKLTPTNPETAGQANAPQAKSTTVSKLSKHVEASPAPADEDELSNQPIQDAKETPATKQPHGKVRKFKHTRWIVAVIVALLVIFISYRQVYVPHVIQSALSSNRFTSAQGYHNVVNPSKHMIILVTDNSLNQKYLQAMANNKFDARRIKAEDQLAGLAHDLSGWLIGKWRVAICTKDDQSGKVGVLWEYNGTKEVERFQTSSAGRQLRQEYQEWQAAVKEAESGNALGSTVGLLLGSL